MSYVHLVDEKELGPDKNSITQKMYRCFVSTWVLTDVESTEKKQKTSCSSPSQHVFLGLTRNGYDGLGEWIVRIIQTSTCSVQKQILCFYEKNQHMYIFKIHIRFGRFHLQISIFCQLILDAKQVKAWQQTADRKPTSGLHLYGLQRTASLPEARTQRTFFSRDKLNVAKSIIFRFRPALHSEGPEFTS